MQTDTEAQAYRDAGALIERHRTLAIIDAEIKKQSAVARANGEHGKFIRMLNKVKSKIEGEG